MNISYMLKIVIFHSFELNNSPDYPFRLSYEMFDYHNNFFNNHNYDIVYLKDYVVDKHIFSEEINSNLSSQEITKCYLDTVDIFFNLIKDDESFDNSILIGFKLVGIDQIFNSKYKDIILRKKIKRIIFQDDIHTFSINKKRFRFNKEDGLYEGEELSSPSRDHRLDKADIILTSAKLFFENTKNHYYLSKTFDYFWCYNEFNADSLVDFGDKYNDRKNKILLSGSLHPIYKTRRAIADYVNKNPNNEFSNFVDILHHPGYGRDNLIKNNVCIEQKYYDKLKEYRGAFVGNAIYPLNFCLQKHMEILFCGTLGFFEYCDSLEKQMGLIAFEHYIPIKETDVGELDFDIDYYLKYLNSEEGKQIAINGYNHITKNFRTIDRCKQFLEIIETWK